jgi:hypothetical protein
MAVMAFDSFEALAIHLRAASRATTPVLQKAVQDAVTLVADSARESIGMSAGIEGAASGLKGIVGTNDPMALGQEIGMPGTPPSPFMGPAGALNEMQIQCLLLDAVVGALVSRRNAR